MSHTLVIDGHPNPDSLCAALARAYATNTRDATLLAVRDLDFDPILHHGLTAPQELEPDLVRAQALIEEAEHVVVIAPIWWGAVPALLKAFLDRVFLKGWAYSYGANGLPIKLLKGRSARLIITTDSPRWYRWLTGNPTVGMLRGKVFAFCGFSPVRVTMLGPVHSSDAAGRHVWLDRVADLARGDAARLGLPSKARTPAVFSGPRGQTAAAS